MYANTINPYADIEVQSDNGTEFLEVMNQCVQEQCDSELIQLAMSRGYSTAEEQLAFVDGVNTYIAGTAQSTYNDIEEILAYNDGENYAIENPYMFQ